LKPENLLLASRTGPYKLCDFGSVTRVSMVPGRPTPAAHVEEDIQKYTTLQYRAPEMIDLYQGKEIGTKADIWALGCVLYKLCFFADAFEESALAVLNGKYKLPPARAALYSPALLALLRSCAHFFSFFCRLSFTYFSVGGEKAPC
jgi:serine/threonine protein kinase